MTNPRAAMVVAKANSDRMVALVTGAAKRVGRAVALELARGGYDIVIHYHESEADAQRTAEEVTNTGAKAVLVCGDLRDPAAPRRIVDEAWKCCGRIDALVNNAAVFETMPLEQFDFEKFHECLTINLAAPLRLCQLVALRMREAGEGRGGCIVNLCDIAAQRPWKDHLAYGCSKAGLEYATKALARALAPEIRVNGVAPGIAVFPEDYSDELRAELTARVPLKREGTPEEVARVVRFLVESDYITGQIINVDGGRSVA